MKTLIISFMERQLCMSFPAVTPSVAPLGFCGSDIIDLSELLLNPTSMRNTSVLLSSFLGAKLFQNLFHRQHMLGWEFHGEREERWLFGHVDLIGNTFHKKSNGSKNVTYFSITEGRSGIFFFFFFGISGL